MHTIVMVCSGNICRSPMAAVMAEKLLAEKRIDALVISAGTLGINGQPAAAAAIRAISEWGDYGATLEGHRSQGISRPIMSAATHVVVMAPMHVAMLERKVPDIIDKVVRLWEYAEPKGRLSEIADPVNLDDAAFLKCRADLHECLNNWIATLK